MSETLVPIYDPNRSFRVWNIDEIFRGPNTGRFVPNVNDMVLDWNKGFYRVTTVNEVTGLSTMVEWTPPNSTGFDNDGTLIGIDIAAQAESYRVYLDDSVTPHTLAVDSRLHIYGSSASHVKLFKGVDITDAGSVISAMYDQNLNFIGENIPLELVAMPDQHNLAVKSPVVGYTLKKLQDGEIVTCVVYDDAGYVISYSLLIVKNTSFIRTSEAGRKYVMSIRLESPFLNSLDERLLEFPTNMPVDDVPVTGVVTYSDGSEVRLPGQGGRFRLYGMDHFVSTIVGQKVPLVLTYFLGEDEFVYGASPGANRHMSVEYWGTTTEFEKSYTLKLYAFPRWIDDIRGYALDYYLYSLDRCLVYKVTDQVTISNTSPAFRPMDYGVTQRLIFSVDMDKVDPKYPKYRHVQTMEITLLNPGLSNDDRWTIAFSPGQNPPYGKGIKALIRNINVDHAEVLLDNGFNSQEEWLRHVFFATEPLHNYNTEVEAPLPNVFIIETKTRQYEFPIHEWNKPLTIVNDLQQGENIIVRFINRRYENDLQLTVAGLSVTYT